MRGIKKGSSITKGIKRAAITAFTLLTAVYMSACSGGGGGGTDFTLDQGTAVVSKGVIEKFGSIFVNGVEFKTANANLNLPDDPTLSTKLGAENEVQGKLKVGMVVTVKGTLNADGITFTAQQVEFRDNMEAKIGAKDDVNKTLTINGVTIVTDDATKILGLDDSVISFANIPATAKLEVSGLPDDKGGLRATFIRVKHNNPQGEFEQEIKGFIVAINGTTSFDIGMAKGVKSITVPGNATALLPTAKVGDFVELKLNAAGALTKVELEDELHAAENEKVSIEGFVASGTADDFVLNGQRVQTNAQTVFLDGVKANLVVGRKLEAEGPIVNGILIATKVTFKVVNSRLSTGEIEKFGSLFVNGVEFRTLGAKLHLRDSKTDKVLQTETEIQDLLKPGMVVSVKGGIDDNGLTGIAQEIEFRDALEGKIDSIDDVNKTITVMGQIVRVEDNVTRLNDDNAKIFSTAGLVVGNFVEVSAFPDDNGGLRATRVAKKAEGELEVKGFVASIGTGSFGLSPTPGGTATVTVTGSLPVGAIVGSFVEVKANAAPANGAVTATAVQLEDRLAGGEKVEAEGIITSGTVDSFTINGQKVVTNTSTLFEGGLKVDFAVGVKVEAEGPLDANGAIVAVKVMFRSNIKIEANASGVSASGLTVLGKQVAINQFTRVDIGLVEGSHVEVRAYLDRNGKLVASRIVVKNANTRTFLQGQVTLTGGAMTILGTAITINASTQFRISTDAPVDQVVNSTAFLAQVKSGVTVVKVRWATADTTLAVEQAEIQLGK
jgi:hypothetical protein